MLFLAALASIAIGATEPPRLTADDTALLDQLFPRKRWFGRVASGMEWSSDGRYLAYLWNPFAEARYADLYLFDSQSGKSVRITNPDFMSAYDRDARRAIERYKKEDAEEEKRNALDDLAYREAVQKLRKENEDRKEPLPSYPGIGEVEWSHQGQELLITYRDDVYRWKVGEPKPTRVTKTAADESRLEWTADDRGFIYQRSGDVYRQQFDQAFTEQLNPKLPDGLGLYNYWVSPDGKWMAVMSGKSTGAYREVDYITYRGRFAEARRTSQYWGFADNPVTEVQALFLVDLTDDPADTKRDGKPWELWRWAGGEDVWGTSLHAEPFSPDSLSFTFAAYKRNSKELEINVVDLARRRKSVAYKTQSEGEPNSLGMVEPFFLAGTNQLIAMLESSGYRWPWRIDPVNQAASQIGSGPFETYVLRATPDGKSLIVHAGNEHPGRMQIHRLDIATGEMTRLTKATGQYRPPTLSKSTDRAASIFASFDGRPELVTVDLSRPGNERTLTDTHRSGFSNIVNLKPEFIKFKNRNGQIVYGHIILPPNFRKEDKRPLMLYVYGGPLGTGRTIIDGQWGGTEVLFAQLLAKKLGIVCVAIDPRGQSGYGAAFGKANFNAPGVAQVEDLTDAAKYLTTEYGIDPTKVGVNGWSFGGFQTQMCLYTASDVFTLGIAGAGPTEWQNYNNGYTEGVIGLAANGKPEDIDKFSLTNYAKNLRSPLLLLHGMEDTNVLFQHTINVYRKLMQYGKGDLVELVIDPTGGHGLGGDVNGRDWHAIYATFLLKHWGRWTPPAGAPTK